MNILTLISSHEENKEMLELLSKLVPAANDDEGGDNQRVYAQCRFYWPSPIY